MEIAVANNTNIKVIKMKPSNPSTSEQLIAAITRNLDLSGNIKRELKAEIKQDLSKLKILFDTLQQELATAKSGQCPTSSIDLKQIMEQFDKVNSRLDTMEEKHNDLRVDLQPSELIGAINILDMKINNLDEKQNKTFAQVVAGKAQSSQAKNAIVKPLPIKKHLLIVKPKQIVSNKQTEEDLKLNLKPIANQVGIKQIKNAQNGAILVECATEDDRDTIYFHMKDLDTTINVEEPRRREPRLVLHNVAPEIEENQQRFNCLLTKRNLIFSLSGK
jgi:hypothetical protein